MENRTQPLKNELYLVFQPIMHIISDDKQEMTEFEVLLRSKKTHRYPMDMMDEFILFEEKNKELLDWYEEELIYFCQKYPTYTFNFNIHPQQFFHQSTWNFLIRLKKFSKQINIELTEKPIVTEASQTSIQYYMERYTSQIRSLGYKICFDDIGSGQNSLELISRNIEAITCLKFSLQAFKQTDMKILRQFLIAWQQLACKYHIRLVVEGIEDREVSKELFNQGIHWQQGYYWAKAVDL